MNYNPGVGSITFSNTTTIPKINPCINLRLLENPYDYKESVDSIKELFYDLKYSSAYNDRTRFYHNIDHISEMLFHEKAKKCTISQQLAILFHDVVYVPSIRFRSGYNEKLSIDFMKSYFYSTNINFEITKEDIDITEKIILSTIDHIPLIREAELVLDLDLMRLGGSYKQFLDYGDDIFNEYKSLLDYDKNLYYNKQKEFFSNMLSRDKIFNTNEFKLFEYEARVNMNRFLLEKITK